MAVAVTTPGRRTRREVPVAELSAEPGIVGAGDSVLIVDDHGATRSLLELRLRDHDLSTAASVAEAIGVLERREVDVIVSDYSMPPDTGMALLGYVRARGLRSRFVLASAGFPDGVEEEALAADAVVVDKGELVNLL